MHAHKHTHVRVHIITKREKEVGSGAKRGSIPSETLTLTLCLQGIVSNSVPQEFLIYMLPFIEYAT